MTASAAVSIRSGVAVDAAGGVALRWRKRGGNRNRIGWHMAVDMQTTSHIYARRNNEVDNANFRTAATIPRIRMKRRATATR